MDKPQIDSRFQGQITDYEHILEICIEEMLHNTNKTLISLCLYKTIGTLSEIKTYLVCFLRTECNFGVKKDPILCS